MTPTHRSSRIPRGSTRQTRAGLTLIEAIIAVVVLSLAVPTTVVMLHDAASVRADAIATIRATWLANAVVEQIIADAASRAPGLGFSAFADPQTYLSDTDAGLRSRIALITSPYESMGFSYTIIVGQPQSAAGDQTGSPEHDLYRTITVTVSWNSTRGDVKSTALSTLISETGV